MLIRTNALRALVEAEVGSVPVTDKWGEISTILGQRCGSDVAALFAEPSISRSNGTSESIARWYSDADGPAVSFSALDAAGRGTAAEHLTSLLSRLDPVLRDPATSNLIGPIVQIPSMADVMVVGGRPVIVNWGYLPEDIAASPARRESHFRTTLGQYLPGIAVPPFTVGRGPVVTPVTPMAAAAAPAAAAMAAAPAAAAVAAAPVVVTERSRYRPWVPIAIATAVALIALLVLLIPGVLIYPDQTTATADDIELRRQMNKTLEEHVERLRKQLAEAVCTPQNPGGATPIPGGPQRSVPAPGQPGTDKPGQSPDKQGQMAPAAPAGPTLAAAPAPVTGDARPLSNGELLATLERSTVLVLIVSSQPGVGVEGIGSGFFINERQIVTNRHVVESAASGRVFVANKTLTQPIPVRIIAATRSTAQMQSQSPVDFALLEVEQPTGIAGIALPAAADRLSAVTAAGFTMTLVQNDQAFKKLLAGDASAMPEMVVTQGIVTVVQQKGSAALVFHTATISNGNSGGPLTDACGRLVGINTFGIVDRKQPIAFHGALGAVSLAGFLEANNVGFTKVTGVCETSVAAAAPPAVPPAPAGPAPAAPAAGAAGGK